MGNRLFAVPWNAMDLNTDKHAFVLNVDKDKLKNAPGLLNHLQQRPPLKQPLVSAQ